MMRIPIVVHSLSNETILPGPSKESTVDRENDRRMEADLGDEAC